MIRRLLVTAVTLCLAAGRGEAQVLLSDSFDGMNGGQSALNFTGFANFITTGNVDLVAHPGNPWGISCVGAAGSCVDLDGSPGAGGILTRQAFSFNAGDLMRFSIDVSGSQRSSAFDAFTATLQFGQAQQFSQFSTNIGGSTVSSSSLTNAGTTFTQTAQIAGTAPFETWFFEFVAANAGTVQYGVSSSSTDNVGPMVDNFTVTRTASAVPEPASVALFGAGVVMLGVAARRRGHRAPPQ
jgi:hypothetical protein